MKLNVLMKEYYKFLYYQVGESQTCCERCLLYNIRICIFCNASHLMNKIAYTLFITLIQDLHKTASNRNVPNWTKPCKKNKCYIAFFDIM